MWGRGGSGDGRIPQRRNRAVNNYRHPFRGLGYSAVAMIDGFVLASRDLPLHHCH